MKNQNVTLRKATISDGKMLHMGRNDEETRRQSVNMDEVPWDSHIAWLTKSLTNPNRTLLIAESLGIPVGTVRCDLDHEKVPPAELSWTVAPESRGQGFGTAMILKAVEYFGGPLRIIVKPSNQASLKLAEKAGFRKIAKTPEMTTWVRD